MRRRRRLLLVLSMTLLVLYAVVNVLTDTTGREAMERVAREASRAVGLSDGTVGGRGCQSDPAALPPPPPQPDGQPANFFYTCGARIMDQQGRSVRLTGVSWFGMETGSFAPHGLWERNWQAILDQIASLGFNVVRLPFSNEAVEEGRYPSGINYHVNPDLEGLTSLEIMDRIIEGARQRGLKVILDRHRPTSAGQSDLWYTEEVPEERWIADWVRLVSRYRHNDAVIGVDLHNEPRGAATWGSGDISTDWRLAAERAGNAVLEANPYLLVFVEGVERHGDDYYWWGGNLMGAREHPVRLNVPGRVVYSPHDYGPSVYMQSWFEGPDFARRLPEVWDRHWGYLAREELAPVVLGEFGGRSVGDDREGQWQRALLRYLEHQGIGWITWSLNPNSYDTGGVLSDDWQTVLSQKAELYRQYAAAPLDVGASGTFGPPQGRLLLRLRNTELQDQTSNISFIVQVANEGPDRLKLAGLEIRYWFTAGQLGDRTQEAVVDYAAVGAGAVEAAVVTQSADDGLSYVRLRFAEGAGWLEPYSSSGDILVRVHKSDWTAYQQSNDFSFKADGVLGEWDQIALYRGGARVWGREPTDG